MAEEEIIDIEDQFQCAARFLESVASQLDSEQLLEFYSYYKQATHGPCDSARPGFFNMTARKKWDAWNSLGDLSSDEAMKKYIDIMTELFPSWTESEPKESMTSGWVAVSSLAKDEPDLEDSEKLLSDWVREGDKAKVKQFAKNDSINKLDSEGLGPIHWAADRGNLDMIRFLVFDLKADVDLKDEDGQTALHYAASCGHTEVVRYLIESGANTSVQDSDGATPLSVTSEADIVALLS